MWAGDGVVGKSEGWGFGWESCGIGYVPGISAIWHFASSINKAGYTATEVACGRAGAIFEVTRAFGQEQRGQSNKIIKKRKV